MTSYIPRPSNGGCLLVVFCVLSLQKAPQPEGPAIGFSLVALAFENTTAVDPARSEVLRPRGGEW